MLGRSKPKDRLDCLILLDELLPPQQTGGSQKTALEMAAALVEHGRSSHVAGRLAPRQMSGARSLLEAAAHGRAYSNEQLGGVRIHRFFKEQLGVRQLLQDLRPRCVLLHGMGCVPAGRIINELGIPLVVYWHDVETQRLRGDPRLLKGRFLSNSDFTRRVYYDRYGLDSAVIAPIFARPVLAPSPRLPEPGERVLFINPVQEKGVERAIRIAEELPLVPFQFLESWMMTAAARRELRHRTSRLENIALSKYSQDMSSVYAQARLLLVPSVWKEAWGRVVTEAQAHGVPAVASRIGGLPEAVGSGGIMVDPNASQVQWTQAVWSLWSDRDLQARYSELARESAARDLVNPELNCEKLCVELDRASNDGFRSLSEGRS